MYIIMSWIKNTVGKLNLNLYEINLPVISVPPVEAPPTNKQHIASPEIIPQNIAATRESPKWTGVINFGKLLISNDDVLITNTVNITNFLLTYLYPI